MKLDTKKPYGVVYGHATIAYQQDGKDFDGAMNQLDAPKPVSKAKAAAAPALSNAEAFLRQILKENPLSKSAVFKEVESNNQNWNDVRTAAADMGIQRYTQNTLEMWRLPESVA